PLSRRVRACLSLPPSPDARHATVVPNRLDGRCARPTDQTIDAKGLSKGSSGRDDHGATARKWGNGELNWSEPSPELLSAYEATDYVVDASGLGSGKHVLIVGAQGANAAAALLRRVHAHTAVIVTAWNP